MLIVSLVWLLTRACPVFLALLSPLRDGGAMLLFAAQRVVGRFAVEGCVAAWVAVGDRTWNCYKQTNIGVNTNPERVLGKFKGE